MSRKKLGAAVLCLVTAFIAMTLAPLAAQSPDKIIIPFQRFGLDWSSQMPQDQIVLLRIWYSMDNGQTWKIYSETENPSTPAPVRVKEDGVYGFYTQTKDRAGLEETLPLPGTAPKVIVVVDTNKPALVLVAPNSAEVFNNTQDMRIEWNASDINFGPTPISLYYSSDGGATWGIIKKDIANKQSYLWKLPAESSKNYRVKVIAVDEAGNSSSDVSDSDFIVDGKAPISTVTGPKDAKSPNFDITYNAEDVGGAGVAKIVLYYKLGENGAWQVYGEDRDLTSPIHFEAPKGGKYGFALVATDRVGNAEASPDANTMVDLWCLMDAVPPSVSLLNFKGSISPVGGGLRRDILWKAEDDNIADNPVTLEFTIDKGATWKTIVSNHGNTGKYAWVVPTGIDVSDAMLKVTVLDVLGNQGMDKSDAFEIDSTPPVSRVRVVSLDDRELDAPEPGPLQEMTPKAPEMSAEECLLRAGDALENRDLSEAQAQLDKAFMKDANNAKAFYIQGRLYTEQQNLEAAAKAYSTSIKLDSGNQDARISLGATYLLLGNKAFGEKQTDETKAYFRKSALEYEEAVKIAPDVWEEYFNLGYIYARLSKYEEAVSNFKKAVPLKADNGDAWWYLGQVYERQQQVDDAISAYKEAAKVFPADSLFSQKALNKVRELEGR